MVESTPTSELHLPWWRRLARNRMLDVGAAAIALICVMKLVAALPSRANKNDFAHYYVTSRLLLAGTNPYGRPLAADYAHYGFEFQPEVPLATNTPALLWLFTPFGILPARIAYWMWTCVQAACLAAILWLTRLLLAGRLSGRGWCLVCAATLGSATVYCHFLWAQWQLLLAALVLAGFFWHQRGKHTLGCLAITTAGLIKLYPFVLVPWFVWRARVDVRARLRLVGTLAACIATVVLVTDVTKWWSFLQRGITPLTDYAINRTSVYTLPSLLINLGYAWYGFAPPPEAARRCWMAGNVAGAAFVALALIVCLNSRGDEQSEFCLMNIAMLMGMFKNEAHYLVFLVFPMAVMAVQVAARPTAWRVLCFAFTLLAVNHMAVHSGSFLDRHIYAKVLANYVPLYGLMVLVAFFTTQLIARGRDAARD